MHPLVIPRVLTNAMSGWVVDANTATVRKKWKREGEGGLLEGYLKAWGGSGCSCKHEETQLGGAAEHPLVLSAL